VVTESVGLVHESFAREGTRWRRAVDGTRSALQLCLGALEVRVMLGVI
jgi:hypothetical protein